MSTKGLLSASAIVLAVAGLAGSFAPQELLAWAGLPAAGVLPVGVQILAALYLAFAMVNWMSRGSLMGGIYNRPVAIGNVMHFTIGALSLVKAVGAGERAPAVLVAAAIYVIFAIAFGKVLFTSPVQRD